MPYQQNIDLPPAVTIFRRMHRTYIAKPSITPLRPMRMIHGRKKPPTASLGLRSNGAT